VTLTDDVLRRACGFRHGIVLPVRPVTPSLADPPGVANAAVLADTPAGERGAGGAGRTTEAAELAAIGEALERYAAQVVRLPEHRLAELEGATVVRAQSFSLYGDEERGRPDFPHAALYGDDISYTNVFALDDNEEVWVPTALVALYDDVGRVSTSSGLAAARSPYAALLRAVEELVERDALAVTWMHGLPGRRIELAALYTEPVEHMGGQIAAYDATPQFSPHPVALVVGSLPRRGEPRFALGAACRRTWIEAVEKAFVEWAQAIVFAGGYLADRRRWERSGEAVESFDDHALYYTRHPCKWNELPLLKGKRAPAPEPQAAAGEPTTVTLARLAAGLRDERVIVYYRDLTTPDLRDIGVHVVRALSPHLVPLHFDEAHPFHGGTASDVLWRYPWAADCERSFPNAYPHPLG
jgi:ribosomal protein S12 methylthiotransferase accessory factor